ncbi:MAG: SAM-dependent chlorinase/fluorinase [Deltaproteobacteria bacterium]|nr:SAM-dependent chlorinase/fluorinase [Deltaproteobacteria bacterium]
MKRSGIITIMTDFGINDPYVGMMKGVILSINPDAKIVDITQNVRTGSVLQAAILIHDTYHFFPEGTVHLVVVDPGVGSDRREICIEAGGHIFVGPDNGIFWHIIAGHKRKKIVHLTERRFFRPDISDTFHGRDLFAPVAAHLSKGQEAKSMGVIIEDPVKLDFPKVERDKESLKGQVVRVDNFGNLITNIRSDEFQSFLESREPVIRIGDIEIKRLSDNYSNVESGEILALINSSDMLEIAVNMGRASEYVGLSKNGLIGMEVTVCRCE